MTTDGRIDARTRAGREAEVLAQIEMDGGLSRHWVDANNARPTAVCRLVAAGKIRHVGSAFERYAVVEEEEPAPTWWRRVWDRLRRLWS